MNNELFISDKVPNPLSSKELSELFTKMYLGDLEARETIIKHNIRLVLNQVIKNFYNTPYDKSELVAIGLIGLINSVDTFDISKNFQFNTYAIRCIDNEILMFMRKEKRNLNNDSIYYCLKNAKEEDELNILDILSDESINLAFDYERKEVNIIVRQIVEELSPRDREIIKMYFGFYDDKLFTQHEIANKLNISTPYVSRLIFKTLNKIKIQLKKIGIVDSLYYELSACKERENVTKKRHL